MKNALPEGTAASAVRGLDELSGDELAQVQGYIDRLREGRQREGT